MDPPHVGGLSKRTEEPSGFHDAGLDQTLARLKELEAELAELIMRIRWQMYLGYDKTCVEFLEKLDIRH
jgi:hypothetical protein